MNSGLNDLIAVAAQLADSGNPTLRRHAERLNILITEPVDPWQALEIPKRGRQWHRVGVTRHRDELLREMKAAHFTGTSQRAEAQRAATALLRYRASTWQHARNDQTCPHERGTLQSYLWHISRLSGEPLSGERIRKIWGANR